MADADDLKIDLIKLYILLKLAINALWDARAKTDSKVLPLQRSNPFSLDAYLGSHRLRPDAVRSRLSSGPRLAVLLTVQDP
jgi:hypothetical protein